MANAVIVETRERIYAGIFFTGIAYFLFSGQDASIKLLVTGLSVWQILFLRSATILTGALAIGGRKLMVESFTSPAVVPMLLRSFLILGAWLCFYNAAKYLQLAELTTIYFGAPVIVTLLSIFILGEKVPVVRWVAVLIGFVGVYIACDPATLGITAPVAMVLAAACFWALAIVLMRKIALHESTMVQIVLNNAFFLVIAGVPLLFVWQTPVLYEWLLLIGLGAVGGLGQFALFEGMKRAPVSVIAPFEYTSLIWAFFFGYAIWGDVPRHKVFMGATLIFLAGVVIILGERFRKQD
ncbi:drug/metabolite transporter (DMT)-like permease [Mesorhizobium soli]|jgi:drug/metabolite transporter (DMT)-like permease|uniref:DMT family transporter n=1 Tax=Pseudaminobacter soli (ex Li et al. 2025) TaxID=1295366 RepID=UPI00247395BC|nr:DMT family transporter [Mesorhizobium soli]MDH6229975.1 drug/metabolite transporter (DMT)-like permease [Mesorhizobium soli]